MADNGNNATKRSMISDAVTTTRDASTNIGNDEDGPTPPQRARSITEVPSPSSDAAGSPSSSSFSTENGAVAVACAASPYPSVKLASLRIYKFDCKAVGSFHIRGGNTGNFTIDNCKVTIKDDQGTEVFDLGGPNESVEFKDNEVDNTTTISLTPNEYTDTKYDQGRGQSVINLYGVTIQSSNLTATITSSNNGNISISLSSSYQEQQTSPINIVAQYNDSILLWGDHDFVVNGDGGYIKMTGAGALVVKGSPQRINAIGSGTIKVVGDVNETIQQSGIGAVSVGGKVTGSVSQSGSGAVKIRDQVTGSVSQSGSGAVTVKDKVTGSVSQSGSGLILVEHQVVGTVAQSGSGEIRIKGYVESCVRQSGCGSILIYGDALSNVSQTGCGHIKIRGVHRGGRVLKNGIGTLTVNGTRF